MGLKSFLFIFPILAILGILAALRPSGLIRGNRKPKSKKRELGYEAFPQLLTPAERSFFGVMERAIAGEFRVFVKVRLADLIRPVRSDSRSGWQAAFNRICAKHVDFVICDTESLNILAVVELDDRSHGRIDREVRDALVDAALTEAQIPIIRIAAKHSYSVQNIQNLLRGTVNAQSNKRIRNPELLGEAFAGRPT